MIGRYDASILLVPRCRVDMRRVPPSRNGGIERTCAIGIAHRCGVCRSREHERRFRRRGRRRGRGRVGRVRFGGGRARRRDGASLRRATAAGSWPRRWRGATVFTPVCCSGGGVSSANASLSSRVSKRSLEGSSISRESTGRSGQIPMTGPSEDRAISSDGMGKGLVVRRRRILGRSSAKMTPSGGHRVPEHGRPRDRSLGR